MHVREDHLMAALLTVHTERRNDGTLVLKAAGEIDMSNVDTLSHALSSAVSEAAGNNETVTVDLSAVEYLDSAGFNVLYNHADHIQVIVNPLLMPVFTVSGFTELAHVEPAPPRSGQ
jgi:anti-anti-sigma factor